MHDPVYTDDTDIQISSGILYRKSSGAHGDGFTAGARGLGGMGASLLADPARAADIVATLRRNLPAGETCEKQQ
jgi:hypothetical protein